MYREQGKRDPVYELEEARAEIEKLVEFKATTDFMLTCMGESAHRGFWSMIVDQWRR